MKRFSTLALTIMALSSLCLPFTVSAKTATVTTKTVKVTVTKKVTVKKTVKKPAPVRSYRGVAVKSSDSWKFQKLSVKTREELEAEEEARERALVTKVTVAPETAPSTDVTPLPTDGSVQND